MENVDLLKSQIHSSCRLALPEGLKDLMWDISREVLRAQPQNLCAFIADYLAALLVARENLQVAAHVCIDLCDGICHALLEDELRNFGFHEDVALEAKNVIQNCFERNKVNEAQIMLELLKLVDIEEQHLPAIQKAIRSAFLRHQANRNVLNLSSSSDDGDDVTRAARHTLNLYRQTKPTKEEMNKAAGTIQAAYRAYGVRRKQDNKNKTIKKKDTASKSPRSKFITFNNEELCNSIKAALSQAESIADDTSEKTDDIYVSQPKSELLHTASSISLAGSYLQLPMYKPYCPYDPEVIHEIDERTEKEHNLVDYTLEPDKLLKKRISFHNIEIIENDDDESENSIEEMIEYDKAYEETESIDEELLETTENRLEVHDYTEKRIDVEKTNNTSFYSNFDSKNKNEEVRPTKGMDIGSHHDKTVEMTNEHRYNDETSDNVKETVSTEYTIYDADDNIDDKDSDVEGYPDGTVKHVNSVEDMNFDTGNMNEDNINDMNEVIQQIDYMMF